MSGVDTPGLGRTGSDGTDRQKPQVDSDPRRRVEVWWTCNVLGDRPERRGERGTVPGKGCVVGPLGNFLIQSKGVGTVSGESQGGVFPATGTLDTVNTGEDLVGSN